MAANYASYHPIGGMDDALTVFVYSPNLDQHAGNSQTVVEEIAGIADP